MNTHHLIRIAGLGMLAIGGIVGSPYASAQRNGDRAEKLRQAHDDYVKEWRTKRDITIREGKSARDSIKKAYLLYRDSINRQYAEFMRNPWTVTIVEKQLDPPVFKETEPDKVPEEETKKPILHSKKVKIGEVVNINWSSPQPHPIEQILAIPLKDDDMKNDDMMEEAKIDEGKKETDDIRLKFYGTPFSIGRIDLSDFKVRGNDENAFADGWAYLSGLSNVNDLISDCLKVKSDLQLPDWGFIKMLEMVSARLKGQDTTEQRLLQGFLLNQTGYKVRFCYDDNKELHVLFSSPGIMYAQPRFYLDNSWYYSYTQPKGERVYFCNFRTPGEKDVDFGIHSSPLLTYSPCETREIKVERHPDLTLKITLNKNLIDFYNDYPTVTLDSSPYSMWAIHGNTPVSKEVREQLYPALTEAVKDKSQYEALQLLLKVAQSFPYGYDDEIWGRDRAFWMEESWMYPQSDCEDHAINFSHMVRDILGLDVCLVYYPGHLSSCVRVTDENIPGDYIIYNGDKYIVCDPTYFYCNIGNTAPSNNNAEAMLIPLRKVD